MIGLWRSCEVKLLKQRETGLRHLPPPPKLPPVDTCQANTDAQATQAIAHSADIHTPNATIVVTVTVRHKVTVEVVMCVISAGIYHIFFYIISFLSNSS